MAHLQELTLEQINQTIEGAAAKQTPVTVTVREHSAWTSYHSRLLASDGGHLLIIPPVSDYGEVRDLGSADRVGVSFKFGHYKHVFSATVAGDAQTAGPDGQPTDVVRLVAPSRMQRLQRRAFKRADVPHDIIIRAAFWLGGQSAEPSGQADGQNVWTGVVGNISAGGFQMHCRDYSGPDLDVGEVVGVRLMFGVGGETCFADAQCRHFDVQKDHVALGFQFVGLGHTRESRETLQLISRKVADLHRAEALAERRAS